MSIFHPYSIFPLGDSALVIDFGNIIDENINRKVYRLYNHLRRQSIPFIKDFVPAFSSLAIYYDVVMVHGFSNRTAFETVAEVIEKVTAHEIEIEEETVRNIKIPVCYAPAYSPDLEEMTRQKQISIEEIIHLHTSISYRVYMVGFLPGFPYMGEVDERISVPRKPSPRLHVNAGSVGIAGRQTGVYPINSPGGWQIIGCTPISLFKKNNEDDPVLLRAGDQVNFYAISEDEFEHYKSRHS